MKGTHLGEFEELVLLAVRILEEQASGFAIQQLLEREAGRTASLGAIYATLDRGHRKGFVTSRLGPSAPTRGGKRRRFYALTPQGESVLCASHRIRETLWQHPQRAAT